MNKLLALGFSALLCCVPASMNRIFPSGPALKSFDVSFAKTRFPSSAASKDRAFATFRQGCPANSSESIPVDCTMQSDRCNIMEPTKSGHHQISCCNTDFCNN
ncbi:unnamed protein product [Caretta caretta]